MRAPLALALVASGLAMFPAGAPAAATRSPTGGEGAAKQKEGFHPDTQLPLSARLEDGTVLKSVVEPDHLELLVERRGRRPVRIRMPDEFAQLNRIVAVPGKGAVLIGMASGDVNEVVIVDTVACKVVDHFWCYLPEVSPDARWIAFIKFYPPHFVPDVTENVMVYDLRRDAAANRPSVPGAAADIDVGTRVYPPGTNRPGDNVGTGLRDVMLNGVASERFFWAPDASGFVFADEHAGGTERAPQPDGDRGDHQSGRKARRNVELSLVMARPGSPHGQPVATVYRIRECPGSCNQQLSEVEFVADGLRARFQGPQRDGGTGRLTVKYADFRAPQEGDS